MIRTVVNERYGPPDVLEIRLASKPEPKAGEVLVPRRPGRNEQTSETRPCDSSRVSAPRVMDLDSMPPIPDRWRLVSSLGYEENLLDPYSSNNQRSLCNKCHTKAVVVMDNCATCLSCGYSKCG